MKLIILGKTNEEKGAELEKLCYRLFIQLGYKNVTLNAVGTGAAEYDVYAEKIVNNNLGEIETIPVFAECKAYKNPCNNDHWQKFLGKYAIEFAQNSKVEAYFVALSDVNGNVWRAASDYLKTNSHVHIVAKDNLIEFLISEFHLSSANQIRVFANLYSNRAVDTVDLVLLNNSIYWLIRFNSTDFSLFAADNKPITQENFNNISEYFNQKDFYKFIDLIAEKEHLERILSIKGFIISCALLGIGDSEDQINNYLNTQNFGFSFEDIIKLLPDTKFVSDTFPFKLDNEISKIDFLIYLYSLPFFSTVLTSTSYQSLFDEVFLDDILNLQGGISLTNEQRANAIFLLRISPAAVHNIIHSDNFLVNSSKNLNIFKGDYQFNARKQIVTHFFSLLIDGLKQNMESQPFWKIAKQLGVEKYSFSQNLSINEGLNNEVKIITAPIVLLANISNIPNDVVAPVVIFEDNLSNKQVPNVDN